MTQVFYYDTPVGKIGIAEEEGAVVRLLFPHEKAEPHYVEKETPLLKKAAKQVAEYFAGKRKVFDLPLKLKGTDFQVSCWNALLTVPYGKTVSYQHIAEKVGSPKGFRAVGGANHNNPIPLIVPCHRIIGKDGSLVGFGGGLPLKRYLLDLERDHAS